MDTIDCDCRHDLECSHCLESLARDAGHYQIYFDVRKLDGDRIDVEHAETIGTLCAKCSLLFDLTQLVVPSAELDYWRAPIGNNGSTGFGCADCSKRFANGEQFEAVMIMPVNLQRPEGGATVEISLCASCASKFELRWAEPATSRPGSPNCYACGKYVGLGTGLIPGDPAHYQKLHNQPIEPRWDGDVHICLECFFTEPSVEK